MTPPTLSRAWQAKQFICGHRADNPLLRRERLGQFRSALDGGREGSASIGADVVFRQAFLGCSAMHPSAASGFSSASVAWRGRVCGFDGIDVTVGRSRACANMQLTHVLGLLRIDGNTAARSSGGTIGRPPTLPEKAVAGMTPGLMPEPFHPTVGYRYSPASSK